MPPLSSSAAIMPALRRTRNLLWRPFAWGAFFRIALAAVLAESVVVNFRYLTPHLEFGELPSIPSGFRHASGSFILVGIAALVAVDLLLLAWYAIVRLRFTIFHSLLYESPSLRDGWRAYGKAADRLFRATVLTTFAIVLLVGLLVFAVVVVVFTVLNLRTPEGKFDTGVFLVLFFPTLAFAFTVVATSVVARIVLHDFILPHIAVEGATVREAWRAVRQRIRADREGFFSYFVLRVLFVIVAGPILAVLAFLALWPVLWVLGASAAGYNALLDDATGFTEILRIGMNAVLLVLGSAAGAACAAIFGGPLAVFLRAHALYFYGSRYKALGDLLSEPAVVAAGTRSS